MKWSIETRSRASGLGRSYPYLHLTTAGRDSLFVCGQYADSGWSVRLYNLVTGEEHRNVMLNGKPDGMTTVLYDNQMYISLSYLR